MTDDTIVDEATPTLPPLLSSTLTIKRAVNGWLIIPAYHPEETTRIASTPTELAEQVLSWANFQVSRGISRLLT